MKIMTMTAVPAACATDSPDDERAKHAGGRDQEELASTDLVDEEAHGDGYDKIDDLKDAVDEKLCC
jgi:hypothetical protein